MKVVYKTFLLFGISLSLALNAAAQLPTRTPENEPTATPEPTTVPALEPVDINCSDPTFNIRIGQIAASGRIELANRMKRECEGYIASGSDGYGSVKDVMNSKSGMVASKLQAMTERLKQRAAAAESSGTLADSSPMTDIVPRHELWMGDDVPSIALRIADDTIDMFADFFEMLECLDPGLHGLCVNCDRWFGICIPTGFDLLKSYRWPVHVVQAVQHRGMDGYVPGLLAEAQVITGFPLMTDARGRGQIQSVNSSVNRSMRALANLGKNVINPPLNAIDPDKKLPRMFEEKPAAPVYTPGMLNAMYARAKSIKTQLNHDDRDIQAYNAPGDGFVRMEYHVNRTPLDPAFRAVWFALRRAFPVLALFGSPCHNTKNPRGDYVSSFWSEGGFYPIWPVSLSRYLAPNQIAFPAAMAMKFPVTEAAVLTNPLTCSQYNMANNTGNNMLVKSDPRLKSPRDMLLPLPPFSRDADITKECGSGNQGHSFALINRLNQTDMRVAGQQIMLRGLKTLNHARRFDPTVRRRFYGFNDGQDEDYEEDALWMMHDKDHKKVWDGCRRFNAKSLMYARNFMLNTRDRTLDQFDADDEGDGSWNAAYHWRKFKCCRYMGNEDTVWFGDKDFRTE